MQSPTATVGATTGSVDDGEPVRWEAANTVNTKIPPNTTMTSSQGTALKITAHTPTSGATSTSSPVEPGCGRARAVEGRCATLGARGPANGPPGRPALARTTRASRS